MILKTKTFSYDQRFRIFWSLIIILSACLLVYVVALNYTVRNTIVRQNLERQTVDLSARVGELEFSYIALKNKVSLSLAYERGFKEVISPVYIPRSTSRALSMNTVNR